jgi:phage/plasmid-associated DNA primase
MDITYKNLYEKNEYSENIRNTMYKENTSVLSYYILTLILLNNYQDFLSWCNTNNTSLLQFKKTISNLDSFCKFIEKKYKTKNILDGIDCTEKLLVNVKRNYKKQNGVGYLLQNLRMTICELG